MHSDKQGFDFIDAFAVRQGPATGGLAAPGRFIWPGGVSLVPQVGPESRRCGRCCARGVRGGCQARGRFLAREPGDSFTAWLSSITRSKICDFYRRQEHHPQAPEGAQ